MRYVFANFCSGLGARDLKKFHDLCAEIPVQSLLISVLNSNEIKGAIDYARRCPKKADLWVDSGAFTVWQQGGFISAKWLVRQLKGLMPYLKDFRNVFPVALDVIPGSRGNKPSQKDIDKAVKQSVKNAEYMLGEGLNVIPVHHQGDPLEVFSQYQEIAGYVGVSPANDQPFNSRKEYVQSLIPLLKDPKNPIACHSFGNANPRVVESFPFYTCDAATWKQPIYFGHDYKMVQTKKEKGQGQFMSARGSVQKVRAGFDCIKESIRYEDMITRMWELRGVKVKQPTNFVE